MKLRKIAAVLIAIVVLCAAAPIGGLFGVDGMGFFAPQAEAAGKTYKVGDIVEFGSYPQSRVTNSSLVSSLNSVSKKWVSYGYYSGTGSYDTMVQGDWMKYADFTYNGTKYRAVTFSQYRPYSTCNPSSTSKTYQDDNGYTPNNIYYFKYEPLKWRVLDPSTGFVLCESIIDAQAYSNTVYGYGTDPYGHLADWNDAAHTCYANDYATSSIRAWLNDDFYNIAFSSSQKANILTSKLDNKAYKTSYSEFDGETTYDKVFLLSWSEVQNTAYGFSANTSSDTARAAKHTDYAECQGLWVSASNQCVFQYLRSASNYSISVCYVYSDGNLDGVNWRDWDVSDTDGGVRPAIKISNLSSTIPKSGGSGSSSGNSNKNTTAKPAGGNNVVTAAPSSATERETFAQINAEVEKEASTAEIKFYGDFKYIVVKANAYICGYSGSSKKVKIPSEIDGMPVVGITDNAFAKTSAQEITVPSSVSEFGKNAFGEEDGETRTIVATSGSPAEAYALSAGMNLKKHSTKSSSGIDDSTKFKVVAACAAFAVIGSAAVITLIVVKKCK